MTIHKLNLHVFYKDMNMINGQPTKNNDPILIQYWAMIDWGGSAIKQHSTIQRRLWRSETAAADRIFLPKAVCIPFRPRLRRWPNSRPALGQRLILLWVLSVNENLALYTEFLRVNACGTCLFLWNSQVMSGTNYSQQMLLIGRDYHLDQSEANDIS